MSRQSQKGGDGSTNIQADNIVFNRGIDEKRAREVYREMTGQLRNDFTQEAIEKANSRIKEFENSLMLKMERVEGALEAFSDPSFQRVIVNAQKTAACTEQVADYDLLSELLIHRIQKGEDRVAKTGISVAVDVVDKISSEALLGLTVAHSVRSFFPISGDINQGLDTLDSLYEKVMYQQLPTGEQWLDHLDLLNAIRLNSFGRLKNIEQYYPEQLTGYTDVGIEKQSENHDKAIKLLQSANINLSLLADHTLNDNYVRLHLSNLANLENLGVTKVEINQGGLVQTMSKLTDDQKKAIRSVYELYSQDQTLKKSILSSFMQEWNKRPNLRQMRDWWDKIPTAFVITSAGKVLAHSNAQRCDSQLPPLD